MQDLGEQAPLHIGSLRLHCAGDSVQQIAHGGRKYVSQSSLLLPLAWTFLPLLNKVLLQVKRKSSRVPHRQGSDDSESDGDSSDSDILEDYLSNLQGDNDDSNSCEQQVLLHAV